MFVEDVAEAFDVVLHRGTPGSIYNIGTDFEISNLETVKSVLGVFGFSIEEHIEFVRDRNINDKRYRIDSSRLTQLGWRPKTSWVDGLAKTSLFPLLLLAILRSCDQNRMA